MRKGHRTSTSSPSPLPGSYGELKVPTLQSPAWFPLQHRPSPLRSFPEVTYQHNKRHLKGSFHLGNSKGFRGYKPGTTYEKDILVISMSKYLFLINHNIAYPTGNQGSRHHQMLKASTQLKHVPKGSRVPSHMNGLLSGRSRDQLAVQQVMILSEFILYLGLRL